MENEVKTEKINTTIVGTIVGETVNITYENLSGETPNTVQATSFIPDGTGTVGAGTTITIYANKNGQKNMTVNGNWSTGNLFAVMTGMQDRIDLVFNPTV